MSAGAAVAAGAVKGRCPSVACGHERALASRKCANGHARGIVHPVNRIDRKLVEQPFLHHDSAADEPFFSRLKDEMDLAREIATFDKIARRAEKHRGMAVVAASMHFSWNG